jgi:3-methyladenine DNA glycosylase AlkD
MDLQGTLETLRSLGKEQNRKIYRRHGAAEDVYGVSYADLKALKKKVKVDHELAEGLWGTGNHDARIFATMVGDAKRMSREDLETWVETVSNYTDADAFAGLASASPAARQAMQDWIGSDDEWTASTGWKVLAHLAMKDTELPDGYFEEYLGRIERQLQGSKNRVRHEMNGALIAIGLRNPALEKKALAASARIGKMEVDHGETGCKTPDAAAYIRKTLERRKG